MTTASPNPFTLLPLNQIREGKHNLRRTYNPVTLAELATSIERHGVLEPVIVRPNGKGYEMVAGHRRLRATKIAKGVVIPAIVRTLTPAEALEICVVENSQREDVHPLEETDGYAALQKANKTYTPEVLAAKIGRSVSYVYRRLQLKSLGVAARRHFQSNAITAAHAERLCRLPAAQQEQALDVCIHHSLFDGKDDTGEPAPVSDLDEWIAQHTKVDPTEAGVQHFFPELVDVVADGKDSSAVLLSESSSPGADLNDKKHKLIGARRWCEIKKPSQRCKHVERGVVVHGGPMRVIDICRTKGCRKHHLAPVAPRATSTSTRPRKKSKWELQHERHQRQQAAWDAVWPRMEEALAAQLKKKATLTVPLVRAMIGDYDEKLVTRLLGPITTKNMVAALALHHALDGRWSRDRFVKVAKILAFDMRPVAAAHKKAEAQKAKAGATPISKKTAKKKATGRRGMINV